MFFERGDYISHVTVFCCAATDTCKTNSCMQKAECFHHFLATVTEKVNGSLERV